MHKAQANAVAIRTQKAIAEAFLSLIQERAYEKISVTDICRRADVVRKTFYNHFHAKDDVVYYLINNIFHEMESKMDLKNMSVQQILLIAFRFVMENREALLLFYNRGLIRFAHQSISAYITNDHIFNQAGQQNHRCQGIQIYRRSNTGRTHQHHRNLDRKRLCRTG